MINLACCEALAEQLSANLGSHCQLKAQNSTPPQVLLLHNCTSGTVTFYYQAERSEFTLANLLPMKVYYKLGVSLVCTQSL